ncbi:ACP S-malonyltransferase [Imhoffiella purpurea]|uniref:[acyl-carrier-protein] S-malonyltransferase n=1 Tax=Imhoffiella purpurea TaxID=1249627 RepID=W9V2G9_9GAMM|nr:acyltransferase domain-containing protein [Imhoffiella purpurea]EXJ13524.1 Malonyl CoA-acyl carrier protein transacylase [Imhoffiella purpurea]
MSAETEPRDRLALLFPGQGNLRPGIGQRLLAEVPWAGERLRQLSEAAGTDLVELLCEAPLCEEPVTGHLAMAAYGLVAFEHLRRDREERPAIMAGHSLGEITALVCAGMLGPEEGLRLARVRGECMAEATRDTSGAMLALVGASLERLREIFADWRGSDPDASVWEVNLNGPQQLVVAGEREALADLQAFLDGRDVRSMPLKTAGAFHTPLMAEAAACLARAAADLSFGEPSIPLVSSMNGRMLTSHRGMEVHLALQMASPVQWLETMRCLQRAQVTRVIEVGPPGGPLTRLARDLGGWRISGLFEK